MKGVQSVVDDNGKKKADLIDLNNNKALREDLYDAVLAEERADEPRESLAEVRKGPTTCGASGHTSDEILIIALTDEFQPS
jgi:hypothetical protein